jgi:hypothetical protein
VPGLGGGDDAGLVDLELGRDGPTTKEAATSDTTTTVLMMRKISRGP